MSTGGARGTDSRHEWTTSFCWRLPCLLIAVWAALASPPVEAARFTVLGIEGKFFLSGSYTYAIRMEEPDPGVISTFGREEIPVPDALKYPASYNFDDGDRNFAQYDAVYNRFTLFGELEIHLTEHIGIELSADAFYDFVYHGHNANNSPESLNTYQQPPDTFTEEAEYFNGGRARLLEAYVYGRFFVGNVAIGLKIGQQVTTWGQSLFFAGIARAQAPAYATRATVPGARVESILMPTNQISTRIALTDKITLLGQWKWEFEPTLLNPVGSFFSRTDIVGPGAEFIYGLKNPFYLSNLSAFDLTSPKDLTQIAQILTRLLPGANGVKQGLRQLTNTLLNGPLHDAIASLPTVSLPALANLLGARRGINVMRVEDIRPGEHDTGQWGIGIQYDLSYGTSIGFYHLNYHNHNPAVALNYGYVTLIPEHGALPKVTSRILGLKAPVTYNVKYFENIHLNAISFTTSMFGISIGAELIYRDGINVMVDVPSGLLGPIPTPTRADAYQILLNGITTFGPHWFWDSLNLIGAIGYIYVDNVQSVKSKAGPHKGESFNELSYDQAAAAFAMRAVFNMRHVYPGWSLAIPVSIQGQFYNRPAMAGAFGSLQGEGDYRLDIAFKFTYLGRLTLGVTYDGFLGSPHLKARPLQDRDMLGVIVEYDFF